MTALRGQAAAFLDLHRRGRPLLQPNAWDVGSARLLETLGFEAIASTSSGFAATLGRLDGTVTREELLEHVTQLAGAVGVPVAADAENGFSDDPDGVAETVVLASATGLAGCSIEDFTGRRDDPIYPMGLAKERVAAAVDAAHDAADQLVVTARAENLIHGRPDLPDTIARLQAYQEAGADVLFAPGVRTLEDIRTVVSSVDRPVNVLALAGCPTVEELASVGVSRISVGGSFAFASYARLVEAADELRRDGTYGYLDAVLPLRETIRTAFSRAASP